MKYGTIIYHNGKEVKGLAKLKHLTLEDIVEYYFLIPLSDALYYSVKALDKLLIKILKWEGKGK